MSIYTTDRVCIGKCTTLFDDVCKGCGRTFDEVFNWVIYTDEERQEIINRLKSKTHGISIDGDV